MFWLNQRESAGDGLSVNRLGLAENGSNLGVQYNVVPGTCVDRHGLQSHHPCCCVRFSCCITKQNSNTIVHKHMFTHSLVINKQLKCNPVLIQHQYCDFFLVTQTFLHFFVPFIDRIQSVTFELLIRCQNATRTQVNRRQLLCMRFVCLHSFYPITYIDYQQQSNFYDFITKSPSQNNSKFLYDLTVFL